MHLSDITEADEQRDFVLRADGKGYEVRPKTAEEIRARIDKITADYRHVLDCGPATIEINAPRALMQYSAVDQLDTLYWALGQTRPRFTCDDKTKRNQ